ncbi:50S ribosomal protein L3 [bacterium]|nr:50S ribosomal protein L3 [bacterium]
MALRLLGKKLGMTQIFEEGGVLTPVTVIELGPNYVVQKKSADSDGYSAVQLGFEPMRAKNSNKPRLGHLAKAGLEALRYLRESRITAEEAEGYSVGDAITVEKFAAGDSVDVSGRTKGRGTAGVIKRHGMHGVLSMTHGSHEVMRHAGSIGSSATPSRVFRGKKMAGRYGFARQTMQNLRVVAVRAEENLLLVKGAVPGPNGSLVLVTKSIKSKG